VLDELLFLGLTISGCPSRADRASSARRRELLNLAAVERHHEQVVVAREGDGRDSLRAHRGFASPPVIRVTGGANRATVSSWTMSLASTKQHPPVRLVHTPPLPAARCAGSSSRASRLAAVLCHDVGRGLIVARPAPLEVETGGIARPSQPGLRITDELWARMMLSTVSSNFAGLAVRAAGVATPATTTARTESRAEKTSARRGDRRMKTSKRADIYNRREPTTPGNVY